MYSDEFKHQNSELILNKFKSISRRKFVRYGGLILLAPVIYAWNELVGGEAIKAKPKAIQIPGGAIPQGFSFHDQVIIFREDDELKIFLSKCTHLGCKINREIEGKLVCACHGSSFDKNGSPLNGPAVKALKKLSFRMDRSRDLVIVNL